MGRGIGGRQVLPLLEITVTAPEKLLRLPFVEESTLEIRWDLSEAKFALRHPRLPTLDSLQITLSRTGLWVWLYDLGRLAGTPKGSITFGPFDLAWEATDVAPSLYTFGPRYGRVHLDTLASWDVVRTFLQDARNEVLI